MKSLRQYMDYKKNIDFQFHIDLTVDVRRHMATQVRDNISFGNGLLPGGTKPSPESTLTYHQRFSAALRAIS